MVLYFEDLIQPEFAEKSVIGGERSVIVTDEAFPKTIRNPAHFQTVIITAATDEMSSQDILAWVGPLLKGMVRRSWCACILDLKVDGDVSARLYAHNCRRSKSTHAVLPLEAVHSFSSFVPIDQELLVILLNDYCSQAFSLLDAVADWLCMVESRQGEVRYVCQWVEELCLGPDGKSGGQLQVQNFLNDRPEVN